jgi:hypothetical protein
MMPSPVGTAAPRIDGEFVDADGTIRRFDAGLGAGPLLLGIYKSSCQASKAIFPMLERIYQAYGSHGLTVWGVSQDSASGTRTFTQRTGVTFPMLVEGAGFPVSAAFDIFATPSIFLMDGKGTIRYATMGFLRDQINEIGEAAAKVVGATPRPIVTEADTDVPFFVPG